MKPFSELFTNNFFGITFVAFICTQSILPSRYSIVICLPITYALSSIGPNHFVQAQNMKYDNLQYNTLGRWFDRLINQAFDGPSIILID